MDLTASLIGIVGIVLAALMSSAGYLYRNITEHKKSARKVLYLLLEIRHSIVVSLFDPDEAADKYFAHYINRLNANGFATDSSDVSENLKAMVSGHFHNMISSLRTDIGTRLVVPFENALLELASIDPVLAYRLRGKEKLEGLAAHTSQYQSTVTKGLETEIAEQWIRDVMVELSLDFKEDALNELSDILNSDVLALARACGWIEYRKCKSILANATSNENKYDFDGLDQVMDKLMKKLSIVATGQLADKI